MTNPGQPFACGATLERISAHTVDALGKEAFITNNPMDVLRKALQLRRMALYFDTGTAFWEPAGGPWREMPPAQWDAWFGPGITLGQQRAGVARHREFVLQVREGANGFVVLVHECH